MKCVYEFQIRKSRDAAMQYAPYFVTVTSSDMPRLERVLVCGVESFEEAESIVADLQSTIDNDRMRDAACIHSVELPEPAKVLKFDSFGRVVHNLARHPDGKWKSQQRRWRDTRGAVLLELALALPIVLLLIVGGLDISFMELSKSNLTYVATATATCIATAPTICPNLAAAQTFAANTASGVGMMDTTDLVITSSGTMAGGTITATTNYNPISPFFSGPMVQQTTAVIP